MEKMDTTAQQSIIIRKPEVRARTGLSDSQIWRLEAHGEFPARVRLGMLAVGWYLQEIISWCEGRPRAGGKQPPLPWARRQPPPPHASHSNGARRPIDDVLDRRIDELSLRNRTRNALVADNIIVVGDLVERSRNDLLELPNFGHISLDDVERVLGELGLHLGMQHPDWDRRRNTVTASAAE
jgi:predicted DNA-binding transcriptional regulator AlpA